MSKKIIKEDKLTNKDKKQNTENKNKKENKTKEKQINTLKNKENELKSKENNHLIKLTKQIEQLQEQLRNEQNKLQESQFKNIELQKKIKQIDLSKYAKYRYNFNTITKELVDEVGTIVQHGIFSKTRISALLGINRNTFHSWLKKGEEEQEIEKPDSLYVQLRQVFNKNKEIFFLKNQLVIEKEAINNNNWNAAKWNIESRFPELRTTNTNRQTSITLPSENPYASPNNKAITDEEKKKQDIKKEITFLITESILGGEDVSSEGIDTD